MCQRVSSHEDLLHLLDSLLRDETDFWEGFYEDREKGVPFFVDAPDESLVRWLPHFPKDGRVLELGCGPGRNAIYLARQGFDVTAVDLSSEALSWARERMEERGVSVDFRQQSIFELSDLETASFDLIYDAGCLHHIPPHRRPSYLHLLDELLKPKGHIGLVCFKPEGGSGLSDREVYVERTMKGGLGFTEEQLRGIFAPEFAVIEMDEMNEYGPKDSLFGRSFLWAALFGRNRG